MAECPCATLDGKLKRVIVYLANEKHLGSTTLTCSLPYVRIHLKNCAMTILHVPRRHLQIRDGQRCLFGFLEKIGPLLPGEEPAKPEAFKSSCELSRSSRL